MVRLCFFRVSVILFVWFSSISYLSVGLSSLSARWGISGKLLLRVNLISASSTVPLWWNFRIVLFWAAVCSHMLLIYWVSSVKTSWRFSYPCCLGFWDTWCVFVWLPRLGDKLALHSCITFNSLKKKVGNIFLLHFDLCSLIIVRPLQLCLTITGYWIVIVLSVLVMKRSVVEIVIFFLCVVNLGYINYLLLLAEPGSACNYLHSVLKIKIKI